MWREARQRLQLRQLDLQLRSAELRLGLAHDVRELEGPMRWVDRGHTVWRVLRVLPHGWRALGALTGLGGLTGVLMALRRPGRVARLWAWVSLGHRLWKLWPRASEAATVRPDPAQPGAGATVAPSTSAPPAGGPTSSS